MSSSRAASTERVRELRAKRKKQGFRDVVVCLPGELVSKIDDFAQLNGLGSRSQVIELVLRSSASLLSAPAHPDLFSKEAS